MIKFTISGKSDKGKKRENNEDNFTIDETARLFIVSDGVGGQASGEVASKLSVDLIREQVNKLLTDKTAPIMGTYNDKYSSLSNDLASSIRVANKVINEAAKEYPQNAGMSATVVAALLGNYELSIANVGDSRIYLYHQQELKQLTRDHTLAMEQLRLGMITELEAQRSRYKHIILRALGIDETVEIDLDEIMVSDGDYLILCTDGLTNMVTESTIKDTIQRLVEPSAICDELVTLANDAGGEDNITLVVVKFFQEKQTWSQRVWFWFSSFLQKL